jgi:photosystem II stability/assembly factor-like uncharacterized protein
MERIRNQRRNKMQSGCSQVGQWSLRCVLLLAFGTMVLAGVIVATAQEVIWEEHTIPIENLRINDLALVDAETAWAVGVVDANPGARPPQVVPTTIHTTDGGKTWNEQETGVERGVLNTVCLLETEMAVAAGQDHGTRVPLVLWTADGGRKWSQATLPPGQGQGYLRNVIFASDGTGWGVGHDYDESESLLWRSSDVRTWTAQSHPIQKDARLSAIAFPSVMVGYAVGYIRRESAKPFMLKTADGGDTWMEVVPPLTEGTLIDIFFLDEQTGWVVGASGDDGLVLKTTDGGASWEVTRVHDSPLYFTRVFFLDLLHGFALGSIKAGGKYYSALWETQDGGATWNEWYKTEQSITCLNVYGNTLWMAVTGAGGGATRILKTEICAVD